MDFVKGLNKEIPSSSVVSQQTYDAATLSGPLANQMAALKAAGAQVVAMATIPAATALAMLPAAEIGFFPQYVISNVGADAPTVGPLLEAYTKAGGGTAAEAAAASGLLSGVITDSYFPPESDTSNAWVQVEKKLLKDYAPALWAKAGLDGNTSYGIALAYTFVEALKAAGKNLTRQSLISAIEKDRRHVRDARVRAALVLDERPLRLPRRRGCPVERECSESGDPDGQLDRNQGALSRLRDEHRVGAGDQAHRTDVDSSEVARFHGVAELRHSPDGGV